MSARAACLLSIAVACKATGGDEAKPGSAGGSATMSPLVVPPPPPLPVPPRGLPPLPPPPFENTTTQPAAIALGEVLFYDARLSADGKVACATCHDPARGFAGPKTPALVNLTWKRTFGSKHQPIDQFMYAHVKATLGGELYAAIGRVADLPLYRAYLERVDPRDREHGALHGLVGYSLTRYAGDAPWDREEESARMPKKGSASDPVVAGYALFVGKAGCAHCHPPPLYTDLEAHDGVDTPTLRGAAGHAAFFHDARAKSLDDAIADAAHGQPRPRLSADDARALAAFVRALTSEAAPPAKPALP